MCEENVVTIILEPQQSNQLFEMPPDITSEEEEDETKYNKQEEDHEEKDVAITEEEEAFPLCEEEKKISSCKKNFFFYQRHILPLSLIASNITPHLLRELDQLAIENQHESANIAAFSMTLQFLKLLWSCFFHKKHIYIGFIQAEPQFFTEECYCRTVATFTLLSYECWSCIVILYVGVEEDTYYLFEKLESVKRIDCVKTAKSIYSRTAEQWLLSSPQERKTISLQINSTIEKLLEKHKIQRTDVFVKVIIQGSLRNQYKIWMDTKDSKAYLLRTVFEDIFNPCFKHGLEETEGFFVLERQEALFQCYNYRSMYESLKTTGFLAQEWYFELGFQVAESYTEMISINYDDNSSIRLLFLPYGLNQFTKLQEDGAEQLANQLYDDSAFLDFTVICLQGGALWFLRKHPDFLQRLRQSVLEGIEDRLLTFLR